jgi:hypothetical protein
MSATGVSVPDEDEIGPYREMLERLRDGKWARGCNHCPVCGRYCEGYSERSPTRPHHSDCLLAEFINRLLGP